MSITRINHFEAAAGCEQALFKFMQDVVAIIRSAEGCMGVELLLGAQSSAQLAVIEHWQSIACHQTAATLISKEQMIKAIPLFAKPPYGVYYQVAT